MEEQQELLTPSHLSILAPLTFTLGGYFSSLFCFVLFSAVTSIGKKKTFLCSPGLFQNQDYASSALTVLKLLRTYATVTILGILF